MKYFRPILSLVILFSFKNSMAETRYYPGSFALDCLDQRADLHRQPLSFYEFKDDIGELTILPNYLDIIQEISPMIFSNFKKDFQKVSLTEEILSEPNYAQYDSIILPPKGCKVITAMMSRHEPIKAVVNKSYWRGLSPEVREYLQFELFLENYLSRSLSRSDYRRFALYIATGKFREFNDEEKTIFLRHYGIKEFNYSGVSIDLSREILFYEDTHTIKDGFSYPKALFEGAIIDDRKFVSFTKKGVVSAVATLTPFGRTIKGQTFQFFIPKDLMPTITEDPRYYPRTFFHANGNVKDGLIVPVENFFNIVTSIKRPFLGPKRDTFQVRFNQDYTPNSFNTFAYQGHFNLLNKSYQVIGVIWWPNGNPKEVAFNKPYPIVFPDKGVKDVRYLLLNDKGIPESMAL